MKNKIYITLFATLFFTPFVYAEEIFEQTINQAHETIVEIPEISEVQEVEIQEPVTQFVIESDSEISSASTTTTTTSTSTDSDPASTTDNVVLEDDEKLVQIFIRNNADIIFDSSVYVNTEDEMIEVVDMNNVTHKISSQSVLAYLISADRQSDAFDITKLQYFDSFDSFYLKCISISGTEYCDNWQYLVDGFSPWTGIDQTYVKEGNMIGFYFGNPFQIVFNVNEFLTNTPFVVTAQQYEYKTNAWLPRTGVTLGVTTSNPDDPWTPLEISTSTVNLDAQAIFTIATSGQYMIGVKDDYYYPLYPITVSTSTISTTTDQNSLGGGSSNKNRFDVESAINFIKKLQKSDGSYGGSELYSDWVAIAFGSASEQDSKLQSYLNSKSKIKSIITDNERRAMAILASGENPYKFNGVNYIQAIIDEFDGTQIGDKNLVNDDIFGILVLGKSGYESTDVEIQKTIEFILSKQLSNGSWENSYDLTAAAIQSLYEFDSVSGVSSSITKAKNYIRNGQQSDGGWGNIYATAWVAQAMHALGENWSKNSKDTQSYFADSQKSDGGVLDVNEQEESRIWATSYVIPAVLELSWGDILQEVSKPSVSSSNNESSNSNTNATSTATSTLAVFVEEDVDNATTTQLTDDTPVLKKEDTNLLSNLKIEKNTDSNIDATSSTSTSTDSVQTQVAAVGQVPLLKMWWIYVLGGIVLFGFGLKMILKNK